MRDQWFTNHALIASPSVTGTCDNDAAGRPATLDPVQRARVSDCGGSSGRTRYSHCKCPQRLAYSGRLRTHRSASSGHVRARDSHLTPFQSRSGEADRIPHDQQLRLERRQAHRSTMPRPISTKPDARPVPPKALRSTRAIAEARSGSRAMRVAQSPASASILHPPVHARTYPRRANTQRTFREYLRASMVDRVDRFKQNQCATVPASRQDPDSTAQAIAMAADIPGDQARAYRGARAIVADRTHDRRAGLTSRSKAPAANSSDARLRPVRRLTEDS